MEIVSCVVQLHPVRDPLRPGKRSCTTQTRTPSPKFQERGVQEWGWGARLIGVSHPAPYRTSCWVPLHRPCETLNLLRNHMLTFFGERQRDPVARVRGSGRLGLSE